MTGEPVPIGGLPEPGRVFARFTPLARPSFFPQSAWLQGSVLTVIEGPGELDLRQCDLATAWKIRLRAVPPMLSQSFGALYAWQLAGSLPARLVLTGPYWVALTADQLRLLADVLAGRPGEPGKDIRKVIKTRHTRADYQERQTSPVDWSFRTHTQGRK